MTVPYVVADAYASGHAVGSVAAQIDLIVDGQVWENRSGDPNLVAREDFMSQLGNLAKMAHPPTIGKLDDKVAEVDASCEAKGDQASHEVGVVRAPMVMSQQGRLHPGREVALGGFLGDHLSV